MFEHQHMQPGMRSEQVDWTRFHSAYLLSSVAGLDALSLLLQVSSARTSSRSVIASSFQMAMVSLCWQRGAY